MGMASQETTPGEVLQVIYWSNCLITNDIMWGNYLRVSILLPKASNKLNKLLTPNRKKMNMGFDGFSSVFASSHAAHDPFSVRRNSSPSSLHREQRRRPRTTSSMRKRPSGSWSVPWRNRSTKLEVRSTKQCRCVVFFLHFFPGLPVVGLGFKTLRWLVSTRTFIEDFGGVPPQVPLLPVSTVPRVYGALCSNGARMPRQ